MDLDKQAVEITQLNLLLKIAEKRQRLPHLEKNIRLGNSLIDDDIVADSKAFNWNKEFETIMKNGGFDVVIGNPPYGSELSRLEFNYLKKKYVSAEYKIDTYGLFLERALDLLKNGGYFGYIIPNTILTNNYFQNLRTKILNECQILYLLEFGYYVFQDAKIDSLVIILRKEPDKKQRDNNEILYAKIEKPSGSLLAVNYDGKILQSDFSVENHVEFNVSRKNKNLLSSVSERENCVPLKSLVNINLGFRVRSNEELIHTTRRKGDVPVLHGRDISRYCVDFQNRYFTWNREEIVGGCSKEEVYEADEKLLIQAIRNIKLKRRIVSAYDDSQFFVIGGLHSVTKKNTDVNLKYILALLNSKLLNFYFKSISIDKNIKVVFLYQLPIILGSRKQQSEIQDLVDTMISLNVHLRELGEKRTDERATMEDRITKTDAKIDELIYGIYGITEEEQKLVESQFTAKEKSN